MKILVIGSGAREHALIWKLAQSPRVGKLFAAPGNPGTGTLATNLPIPATDLETLSWAAHENGIDLTIVGPEAPLAEGIVDRFHELGLWAFGPREGAARIESSKVFAKQLMEMNAIPTASGRVFEVYEEARYYIEQQETPMVVKADGLAGGKGVTVARTHDEAYQALNECMLQRTYGAAGDKVIVEECLEGQEVSVFAFTDGESISSLVTACDYKRAFDGDRGPNTGGMGSYSPPAFWTPELTDEVERSILRPILQALADDGNPYNGVLYVGLMLTEKRPTVMEFNCRLGDPEAQVILPRLETDLVDIAWACLMGNLSSVDVTWSDDSCVGVVLAAGGYPGEYRSGLPITGLNEIPNDVLVFQGGTGSKNSGLVTTGGRVLTVVSQGADIDVARQMVYSDVPRIQFDGAFYRHDVAGSPARR